LTRNALDELKNLRGASKKVETIKMFREFTGAELTESKELVEYMAKQEILSAMLVGLNDGNSIYARAHWWL
jgi:hypothetical protein